MQSTDQVTQVSLALAQADAAVAAPAELSPEMLALVAGGSPRGGWELGDTSIVGADSSPRGGW